MYGDLCCYCEGNTKLTGYEEIEHYKLKWAMPTTQSAELIAVKQI
jgi:hypothetical protein